MSSRYSACFSFTGPNISSRSTCEKPRMAFSGVRSSCDMLARNSDLCRLVASSSVYKRLSSSFIPFTLAAKAPSSSRLTTSTCPVKSPEAMEARRPLIRWIGSISDQDRTNPRIRASTSAVIATPIKRSRELSYARAFRAIRSPILSRVPFSSSSASCFRSLASISARGRSPSMTAPSGSCLSSSMSLCITTASRSAFRPIDRERGRFFGGGSESQLIRCGCRPDAVGGVSDRLVDSHRLLPRIRSSNPRPPLAELPARVLCEEPAQMPRISLEPCDAERPLLEGAETPRAVVRLVLDAEPEQTDGDEEHRRPNECDQELGVDRGRHTADRLDDRIVPTAKRSPLLLDGGRVTRKLVDRHRLKELARSFPLCRS